ncbi:very short patch repair endonuclease [Altererythrobacter sp. Z27]|uniref:very short patch repair endonuclease n=1 Tax=Altererythrobacter sp. Z27 TaxID=3461147 RepID=UPI004044279E
MAGIGAKNTKPEILIRRILHQLGYRFRLHRNDLPGKPDIVLPKWNAVIFVHGCFWHGHENCPLFRLPKSRTEFWAEKISSNKQRDENIREAYARMEWRTIEVWECATKGRKSLPPEALSSALDRSLKNIELAYQEIRGS